MVKIGMMIGDRYEILEKIGTGGMSDVYRAKCHKLNRFVAVKVLKQEFAENENFVSKFIIEAQAAAGLMHPNIVNVYDVGEENGIHYIVMELIEGITLKKYIEKKSRLSYKEAVSIAIQVSMGIEAAHNNHIIHRDIKPQNIIISRDGKVKVTDFGIAKAATSNTISSNVMGSVHYTSPEQARGGYSDEKSDVYSLGITMFEMLTGRVPFNGDTTVAIAIKHIQEELPFPSDFVPEIPVAVESIVLKCCQKSPDRRYQNMGELLKDLKQALQTPDEDFVELDYPDLDGGTRPMTDWELDQVRGKAYPEDSEGGRIRLRDEQEDGYDYGEAEDYGGDGYDRPRGSMTRTEKITAGITIMVGIIILVIIIFLSKQLMNYVLPKQPENDETSSEHVSNSPILPDETEEVKFHDMPSVVGRTEKEARQILEDVKMKVYCNYVNSDEVPAGNVISASVEAGTSLKEGSKITLTVSAYEEGIKVPLVTGMRSDEASSRLQQLGFRVNIISEENPDYEAGYVFDQNPSEGTVLTKDSYVSITVSEASAEANNNCTVPNLIGRSESEGRLIIMENNLSIGKVTKEYSDKYAPDVIFFQSHSAGTIVAKGTYVDITVSLGPRKTTYKCDLIIQAPSSTEAPDFRMGTTVELKLETDTGLVLLNTKTSSFPYTVSFANLESKGGTLSLTYTVTIPGDITVDPETGNSIIGESTTEKKTITRRIDFVEE